MKSGNVECTDVNVHLRFFRHFVNVSSEDVRIISGKNCLLAWRLFVNDRMFLNHKIYFTDISKAPLTENFLIT